MKRRTPASLRVIKAALLTFFSNWYGWVPRCVLWILCWLTVILGPPATFALVVGAEYSTHGVFSRVSDLAAEARRFFWMSWAWMLSNLLVAGLLWVFSRSVHASLPGFVGAANWVIFLVAVAWLVVQFYAIPFLVTQDENNLFVGLRKAVVAAGTAPGFTLVIAGLGLLVAVGSLVLVAPLALGGPALVAVLASEAVQERSKSNQYLRGW